MTTNVPAPVEAAESVADADIADRRAAEFGDVDGGIGSGLESGRGKSSVRHGDSSAGRGFPGAALADRGVRVCAVLALAGVAAGSWFGWSWWSAAHDPALTAATTRDVVLDVGRRDLARLNTVHYQNPDADLTGWLDISTGQLHDELSRDREGKVQGVRAARTSSSAAVQSAAVTRLDVPGGKAELVAVLDVTLTVDGHPPTRNRSRLTAELVRTADGWRVAELTAMASGGAA